MNIMSNILSIIAIIISAYSIYEKVQYNKNSRKYNIFSEQYINVLIDEIPFAYSRITIENQKMYGVMELHKSLRNLKENIKVIQIVSEETYNDWLNKIEFLETFIINQNNISFKTKKQEEVFFVNLKKKLQLIYSTILKEDYKNILK